MEVYFDINVKIKKIRDSVIEGEYVIGQQLVDKNIQGYDQYRHIESEPMGFTAKLSEGKIVVQLNNSLPEELRSLFKKEIETILTPGGRISSTSLSLLKQILPEAGKSEYPRI